MRLYTCKHFTQKKKQKNRTKKKNKKIAYFSHPKGIVLLVISTNASICFFGKYLVILNTIVTNWVLLTKTIHNENAVVVYNKTKLVLKLNDYRNINNALEKES